MRKTIFPLIVLFNLQLSAGQPISRPGTDKVYLPRETTILYKLGDRVIQLKTFQYGNVKDMVYINLHDDEITAINGARKVLEKKGGFLIKIENYRTRNIKFKLDGKYYTIDPNRMFSRVGIARSLIIFGHTSPKAIDEIEKFANRVLQLIPAKPSYVIALHNNTNGKYSINSYLPGGDKKKDAKALNVNEELDADDFFLTTDSVLFSRLSGEKYNTVLQDNENAKKDGSLSVYCGERNILYVNCETEHGRQPEYDEMIAEATNRVQGEISRASTAIITPTPTKIETKNPEVTSYKRSADMIAYNYRIITATKERISPKTNTDILFGDKKVGLIRSVLTDSSLAISGKLEMNKDFPLYSNMDIFLFLSPGNIPQRIEVRIDPTRKKEQLNPQTALISFNTKTTN